MAGDFKLISFSLNHIDGWVDFENQQWRLIGFYGLLEEEKRGRFWDLMRWLRGNDSTPWLTGGDFNGILHHKEKKGGRSKDDKLINDFRHAVDDCNLVDLGYIGDIYTWCDRRPNEKLFLRDLIEFSITQPGQRSFLIVLLDIWLIKPQITGLWNLGFV